MTEPGSQSARQTYCGPRGEHTGFDADFRALCDRYQVQAAAFYAGFKGNVVMTSRSYDRRQFVLILQAAFGLIPEVIERLRTTLVGTQGLVSVRQDQEAP